MESFLPTQHAPHVQKMWIRIFVIPGILHQLGVVTREKSLWQGPAFSGAPRYFHQVHPSLAAVDRWECLGAPAASKLHSNPMSLGDEWWLMLSWLMRLTTSKGNSVIYHY